MGAVDDEVGAAIAEHRAELARPGVLSVRSGFEISGDWLTGHRAVVVTVEHKRVDVAAGERLPDRVGGVRVDVRQASPAKRQELLNPGGYAARLRLAPDTGSIPHFPDEQSPAGQRLGVGASAHIALAARVTKPQLEYTAPAGVTLSPVTDTVTVQVAASPDAGWPTLKPFLSGAASAMTVGMYDFTSAHVLTEVEDALAGRSVSLVLDHPALNPTADQSDADTVAALDASLGAGLSQAWALTRSDKDATAWIYPTSYHIKVAVRDHDRFWLSSGNWNNSNQPDIDPVTNGLDSADAVTARHSDRDWHVVVDHPGLAAVFEAYLGNDLTVAAGHNGPAETAGAPLPAPPLAATATPPFAQFFPATTITAPMTLTPLLTPDPGVYADTVKALIASAQTSLYLQFQYIELPTTVDATSQAFVDLVSAVVERQTAGVDVKIIMSEFEKSGYLEQLQGAGLDVVHNVKIQNNVHNKGIIVDTNRVLVSSQNWSTDGTLYNRDAGLIIDHPDAAAYYQQIFLHDWTHLAHQHATPD